MVETTIFLQPVALGMTKLLNRLPSVGATDNRADRQQDNIHKIMTLVTFDAGVFKGGKMVDKAGRHERLLGWVHSIMPQLPTF